MDRTLYRYKIIPVQEKEILRVVLDLLEENECIKCSSWDGNVCEAYHVVNSDDHFTPIAWANRTRSGFLRLINKWNGGMEPLHPFYREQDAITLLNRVAKKGYSYIIESTNGEDSCVRIRNAESEQFSVFGNCLREDIMLCLGKVGKVIDKNFSATSYNQCKHEAAIKIDRYPTEIGTPRVHTVSRVMCNDCGMWWTVPLNEKEKAIYAITKDVHKIPLDI